MRPKFRLRKHDFSARLRRAGRYVFIRFIRLEDSPHRIAAGFAVGTFVAFTPTIPFQMILALIFAIIFRVNRIAAIAAVWSTNVFTAPPVFYANYRVGVEILNMPVLLKFRELRALINEIRLTLDVVFWREFMVKMMELGWNVLAPLMVGSLVVAVILGIASYFVALPICKSVSRRRHALIASAMAEIRARQARPETIIPETPLSDETAPKEGMPD